MILTYQGQAVHALSLSEALGKQQIFARYVQRMLERKAQPLRSTQHDLIHWLSWLAQQMRKQSQTVFYLEHLQPDWLERTQRRQYAWWAVRVPALLVGMLRGTFRFIISYALKVN